MKSNRRNSIYLAVCLLFILFITLFSRVPTLTRTVHLIPLWSYTSHGHWKQILLNICLFIPFGYFLASLTRPRFALLIALLISAFVETVQFLTYRGMLDVDDLVSNLLGAGVGLMLWRGMEKHKTTGRTEKWMRWIMLSAAFIGCIMVAVPAAKNNISTRITEQFWFSISSVSSSTFSYGAEDGKADGTEDGKVELEGECFLYDRVTPAYTIYVGGEPANTDVDGQKFRTRAEVSEKSEVQIQFKGRPVMPTGTWINPTARGVEVDYVAGEVPVISGLEDAMLKVWNEAYDTLVYQDGNRLIWLIGTEIDKNTEVIYHIHTDEPEKLPENRVQYGFDNRGFRPPADERASNELEPIDHYRVFEREIPDEYNVTAIVVGFNTDGIITWNDSFRSE